MKRDLFIFTLLALLSANIIFPSSVSNNTPVLISYHLSAQTSGLEVTNDHVFLYTTSYLAAIRLQYRKTAGVFIGTGLNETDIKGTGPYAMDADNRGSFLFGIDGEYPLGKVRLKADGRIMLGRTADHTLAFRKYYYIDTRMKAGAEWPLGIFRFGGGGVVQKTYLNPSETGKGSISDLDGRLYMSAGLADPHDRGALDFILEANPVHARFADGRPQRWAFSIVATGYQKPRRLRGRDDLDRRYLKEDGWKLLEEKARALEKEMDGEQGAGTAGE